MRKMKCESHHRRFVSGGASQKPSNEQIIRCCPRQSQHWNRPRRIEQGQFRTHVLRVYSTRSRSFPIRQERASNTKCLAISDAISDQPPEHDIRKDLKAILLFALPALGSSLASPILSAVDTAVIGRCATLIELAALGPSSAVFDSFGLIFAFLQVASINKLSGMVSSKRQSECDVCVSEFMVLSLVIGTLLMTALLIFATPLMTLISNSASAETLYPAVLYSRIRALSIPCFISQITMQGILMGLSKDSFTPLCSVLLSGVVNLIGDLALVYGLKTGIAGAAWATTFAQCVSTLFLYSVLSRQVKISMTSIPDWRSMLPLLSESSPFLLMKLLTCVKIFLMNYLSTMFGAAVLAAHLVALTIWRILILVGEPLSYTAQSFTPGYFQGDKKEEVDKGFYYVRLILGSAVALSMIMLVVSLGAIHLVPELFSRDPSIVGKIQALWKQICISVCVFPILLSSEGSLLAIGKVQYLVWAMFSNVLFMLAGAYILCIHSFSLSGVWWMFSMMHCFYTLVMLSMIISTRMNPQLANK